MYKVLLVDDEILDLKGMQQFIPWQELGMEVTAAATSGFAAAEMMEKEPVDILVTDVRMPNMSGLELARKALDMHGGIKIIFVSGHQDFHYVKQAMSLNAYGYVVKPMDDSELIEALRKLRLELDEQRRRQETELKYKQMVPIVKNEYLLQLLEGARDGAALDVLPDEYELGRAQWPVRVAVVERDDWAIRRERVPAQDEEPRNVFLEVLFALCGELDIRHICRLSGGRVALIAEQGFRPERLQEAFGGARLESSFTVTVGIGGEAPDLAALRHSYREALSALDFKVFAGKGTIIRYEDIQSAQMEEVQSLDFQLDALFEAMTHYELVKVHDELNRLYGLATTMRSRFTVQNFTVFLIMKLDTYLQKMNEDVFQMLGLNLGSLDDLLQYETIDEIHSWLRYRIYELSEQLHAKKSKKNWKLVQDVANDVRQRLHENVTLKDVAEKYSFTPNYLGQIFKEEMGMNFSDYTAKLRMEKAGELLLRTNLKVYEIANLIGYRYLPYFSRQFKEYYGKTPLEYRRNP